MSARAPGALVKSDRADLAARRMRSAPTRAEALLWKALRRLEPPLPRFRRQAPLGPYVVDFVCHRDRLVIEVDGGVHRLASVALRDQERENWLQSRGYAVLRFDNDEVIADVAEVVQRIVASVRAGTPTPTPPRKGEGQD